MNCPICEDTLRAERKTGALLVFRCPSCSHRVAVHTTAAPSTTDYHEQYDKGAYLASLETTRRRQAALICALVRSLSPPCERVLDLGCGRGWFLQTLKRQGVQLLGGVDSSDLALRLLREQGITGLKSTEDFLFDAGALSFAPRIITLLDVVEHFPAEQLQLRLYEILRSLPTVEVVVIKVPVAEGFLFRSAGWLHRFGWSRPLEQLFQVGTHPPHHHYFSGASLRALIEKTGWRVISMHDDPDVDDFSGRLRGLRLFPPFLRAWGDRLVLRLLHMARADDARIMICARN